MSEKGQVVVPKEIRQHHGYGNGSTFQVTETRSGCLVLRPMSQPKRDLVDHLLELSGVDLQVPDRQHHCPPRV